MNTGLNHIYRSVYLPGVLSRFFNIAKVSDCKYTRSDSKHAVVSDTRTVNKFIRTCMRSPMVYVGVPERFK